MIGDIPVIEDRKRAEPLSVLSTLLRYHINYEIRPQVLEKKMKSHEIIYNLPSN